MFESQLVELFNDEELNKFKLFMLDSNYLWFGKENSYCLAMYIQEFISLMEDNERKKEIFQNCIEKFPQILGLEKENI
jgi:hypothetical protein